MAKSYFRFKQFTVYQDRTAMKVCTDACILGAYAAVEKAATILDIGTGTGVLALMVAQRSLAHIDAVEIDAEAFRQATQNVAQSPFEGRIRLFQTPIQTFMPPGNGLYDCILSNPPFYEQHLRSPEAARNTALHAQTLSFDELLTAVVRCLSPEGFFSVLLPVYQSEVLARKAAAYGLHLTGQLRIRHSDRHPFFRLIQTFRRTVRPAATATFTPDTLTLYATDHTYSEPFRQLLQPYYVIF